MAHVGNLDGIRFHDVAGEGSSLMFSEKLTFYPLTAPCTLHFFNAQDCGAHRKLAKNASAGWVYHMNAPPSTLQSEIIIA